MCTAMMTASQSDNIFFGRTMDFSYPLDPEFFVIPRDCKWSLHSGSHKIKQRYSVLGIGQNLSPVILTDGVNDRGFAAAALYFPGFSHYDPIPANPASKPIVASAELVKFLLGLCSDTKDAVSLLHQIQIVGFKDPVTESVAPLHWMIGDSGGRCMTIEKTQDGLHILENPIGILSNSPDFLWHMTNLRNYMNLSPLPSEPAHWGTVPLTPFGQGDKAIGLPGDFSPPSRFVRCAYLKSHTFFPKPPSEAISACFHIMENLSIPKGVVITQRGTSDYTQYTAFIDLTHPSYFYRTYDDSQIRHLSFPEHSALGSQIHSLGKFVSSEIL